MDGTRYIVAGAFIDGSGARVRRNVFLAVKEGIITDIGPSARLTNKGKSVIEDFSHCIILPALVDCSISLSRSPSVDMNVRKSFESSKGEQKADMVAKHIGYCHVHGVQGVAENDDITDLLKVYKDGGGEERQIIAIRLPDRLIEIKQDSVAGNSAGGDFLKINYSPNIDADQTDFPRMSPDSLGRVIKNRGAKKTLVVCNGPQQVEEALESDCDAIEQGYGMGEDNLRKMAKKGVLWIPSVIRAKNALDGASSGGEVCCRFSQRYVAPGKPVPGAESFWKKQLSEQINQLRFARKLGITTAVGTGAGTTGILHGESIAEEMKLFLKAGYSIEETICCASENGAQFFDMENLGKLIKGRKATFLIARGTLPQLPRKLSYLEGIYVDGLPSTLYQKNPVNTF